MARQSVLLLAPHQLVWKPVREILRADDTIDLTEVASSSEALLVADRGRPDVVILPAAMDERSTIDVIRAIRNDRSPESRIVVFARTADEQELAEHVYLNVNGFLFWRDVSDENYLNYLRTLIHTDATVYSPHADRMCRTMQRSRLCLFGDPANLSERERAILSHLYAGLSRREIARAEGVSERTVKRDIEGIMDSLDAHHQYVLGAKAALLGLVP